MHMEKGFVKIRKQGKLPGKVVSMRYGLEYGEDALEMQPGGGMPNHTNTVEHEQYILRGAARVGIGDKVFEVKQGDVVFIPAGIPHWYQATSTEPFEFLCLVPNLPDKTEILK